MSDKYLSCLKYQSHCSQLTLHELSRVWWCPTGPLSLLPIHAAGLYDATTSPGHKLSDFVVSSYTPTLSALVKSRDQFSSKAFKLTIIAQPQTLPGTLEEYQIIKNRANSLTLLPLLGSAATKESVMNCMKMSTWVHFAGHSVQDLQCPMESRLLLDDGGCLTLSDITRMSLPQAELAYLSSSCTAQGMEALSEEAIHAAAGMLVAGYRGVIATLWSPEDKACVDIADTVYAHLFKNQQPDCTQAAYALHFAAQRLREEGVPFLRWAPFVHFGV
jgi:CHAT domain-containing protein